MTAPNDVTKGVHDQVTGAYALLLDKTERVFDADRTEAAPPYVVRLATLDDVDFLADVVIAATREQGRLPVPMDEPAWRASFYKWTEQQVKGQLRGNTTSVVELDGQRVGRLRVVRGGEYIELAGIQLMPEVQGHGIGTSVVESLKTEAAAAGVDLELGVEKDNPDAHRLYRRLGFVQVGETEDEYRLRWSG